MSSRGYAHNPVKVNWTSQPVEVPADFLSPLPIVPTAKKIDFANSALPEYKDEYAVILDNVLSASECAQFIRLAEMSQGAHSESKESIKNNGWQEAMVNVGGGYEVIIPDYRNSDRIIWDNHEIMNRLWKRILQADEVKNYLQRLEGDKYESVLGRGGDSGAWVPTQQGINERMRFLKYGAGQFFRQHCDGAYRTPDGKQESYYTMHLYLNDSSQALGMPYSSFSTNPRLVDTPEKPAELLSGGATTFHSRRSDKRIDVDPKVGRVLIFQHRVLMHSGDDVKAGIKYTLRSDIMYERAED